MAVTSSTDPTERLQGFAVGPGMLVKLEYRVRDAEGEPVGPDAEHLEAIFGMGQLLSAIERAIDGMRQGGSRQLKLPARDAYGPRDPDALLEVERGEFPPDAQPGDYFEVENAANEILVLRVLEVADDYVLIDMNHPLAGQDLEVELRVGEVRPATQAELEKAMKQGVGKESGSETPLISPESLLRGRARR